MIPRGWSALFQPVRTMTATIAAEMGEVASGSTHYHVLFLIGILLFVISLAVNLVAASVVFRAAHAGRADPVLRRMAESNVAPAATVDSAGWASAC